MLSLKPSHIKRYAQITKLLIKYGRSDLVAETELDQHLENQDLENQRLENRNNENNTVNEDDTSDEKNAAGPDQFTNDLEALGPTFIKFGQLLSTRADFLPEAYRLSLARLQDDAEPIEYSVVAKIIETELGGKIKSIFTSFDEAPLASASIGQVHLATLRGERRVAVKVQRPGVRGMIDEDLEALAEIAEFLENRSDRLRRYQLRNLVDKLEKSIIRELDYFQEARNAAELAENLKEFTSISVPKVFDGLSSERVLTMEYIPHTKITDLHPTVLLELDGKGLADELFRAYLRQVVVDGIFHADPHPGNIALTRTHQLVLMDFGMVERVSSQLKPNLLKFLLAVSDGQSQDVARVAEQSGRKGESFDRELLHELIDSLVTQHHGSSLSQLSVGKLVQEIQLAAGEADLFLPDAIVLLGKALMNLDLVVAKLDPDFNPSAVIQREGAKLLEEHFHDRISLSTAYHTLLESAEFVQELPDRLNRITRDFADDGLTVKLTGVDQQPFLVALQKIANRITAGLIIAALIVGASLTMRVESSLTLFGYPAIASIFFFLAVGAGVALLWQIVFRDR